MFAVLCAKLKVVNKILCLLLMHCDKEVTRKSNTCLVCLMLHFRSVFKLRDKDFFLFNNRYHVIYKINKLPRQVPIDKNVCEYI